MLKKNGGITLIALVVTIIVLLILAGITIAMLTGPNGIISRTNDSKMKQIEGQVQEEVKLAVQSAKIFAMQKSVETSGGGWYASKNVNNSTDTTDTAGVRHTANSDIIAVLREDLTTTKGYTIIAGANAANKGDTTTITVTYETQDYKAATNNTTAKIVATIYVKDNNFRLYTIVANGAAVYTDNTAL